ncbi:FtsW/RodA/SpoVE family cell cycle protein [Amnibacterium kyonggiense]|uniref:Probable peptidoglycan glycosyltransferase FtsW n=1 Tax=Amnibacterium kyonggiense TaxID=595671 RepID=A0A4R7FKX2_9MICO|nr:putative peptidoglycan glycosyltransferase FtsW [Amnibacterium kyonggiense]TDS77023.1 cell division-specific peptidoglycan biosynthesis regulator FtsW [Amnibacterium kyonggiense]
MDTAPEAGTGNPVVRLPVARRPIVQRIALPSLSAVGGGDALALGALTLFLVGFGLVMVLSSSSVEASVKGDPYGDFTTQGLAALVGAGGMLALATRLPTTWLPRLAPVAFLVAVGLQLLTALTPLGTNIGGNQNWIRIGGASVQPSEFVKLTLVLTLASFFSRRPGELLGLKGLVPVFVIGALGIGSVYLGGDLGTTLILTLIVAAALWFGQVRLRVLVLPAVLALTALAVFAQANGSRTSRLAAWQHGCTDLLGTCWQTTQAQWALANGGLTGVGIGNSVSKWFWLPEADNDFIAAIIGEETGLLGLGVLLACFVAMAVVLLRISTRTHDRFTRAAAGMTLAWLVGQAFANIAVVVGVAPVFGVPLPFVSAGGSSLLANFAVVGCLMALADRPVTRPAVRPVVNPAHPSARSRLAGVR